MDSKSFHTLRLILGDQLNSNHSWYKTKNENVLYVLMEVKTETDYVSHHVQKVAGIFSAMRHFYSDLKDNGSQAIYIKLIDKNNHQSFEANLHQLILKYNIRKFEYQLPDEYRLDNILHEFSNQLIIPFEVYDTEHFFTSRYELKNIFEGKKTYLMETFYRTMRKKHTVLMNGDKPLHEQWNFDEDNRKKLPKNHESVSPFLFNNNVAEVLNDISTAGIKTIGNIDAENFIWPINKKQSFELLDYFTENCLSLFGTYQDAMAPNEWSLYHSRLSFSLNIKLISPKEVIDKAIEAYFQNPEKISYNQIEGFVRQILGWREYMRGIYWLKMPEYATLNYFEHTESLPNWYWTGKTKMNCLSHSINQSLDKAYAHHIQRLMVTGNFALLAGVNPNEVDAWYLGIYIDAFDWVEITNTRGMSQFADGGIVGSKPYVSSASYINKMSSYCGSCHYDKNKKVGDKGC